MSVRVQLPRLDIGAGCSIHAPCLTCPLPQCRFDSPPSTAFNLQRNKIIREAYYERGVTINKIVEATGKKERTIKRILSERLTDGKG